MVYAKDRPVEPKVKEFNAAPQATYEAAREVLKTLGYKIAYENAEKRLLRTGWLPTTVDSHYVELFDKPDYGTTGAYYRLEFSLEEKEGKVLAVLSASPRSLVPNIKSSGRVEKKIFSRMADLLRDDIEITNVGVQE
ncbi:MAG: hypothetical protein Q7S00_06690 [bacterium]|nr:hypothetical protein [bacterium]